MLQSRIASTRPQRYDDVAVAFHWLIALMIIGLLIVGKYMTSLADDDPLRFDLIQWHKSFGITVLLLSVLRLLWRLTHRTPAHPTGAPAWERVAAGLSHLFLYVLLFVLPLSGWILVSASPLDIDTLLFNIVPWPHLAPVEALDNREAVAETVAGYHELAGNLLIALLLLHVGAALKHHLIDGDDVLRRMAPQRRSSSMRRSAQAALAVLLLATVGIWQYGGTRGTTEAPLAAGASDVRFVATITGSELDGRFTETEVLLVFDESRPESASLEATVATGSFQTGTAQIDSSLGDEDWLDTENHPEARFRSTSVRRSENGNYRVDGELTIKGISQPVNFPLRFSDTASGREASGGFDINRLDFSIGANSQPDDSFVDLTVSVRFRFDIAPTGAS